ncbi:MAG: CoA transferase [Actinobacteria bacterium]|nr:CoA transferase [Actinomycetota bacterium]
MTHPFSEDTQTTGTRPLEGLRVLDMGRGLAGPFAATLLADFGADVVKVEQPGGGDFMRELGPPQVWWKSVARGKRSIAIDLKHPESAEVMRELVEASDVLIESFRPGVLERMGLAPDTLLKWQPKLIVLRVSGYGQDGPYKDRPGFGKAAEAMAGLVFLSGSPDGPPMHPGFPMADMTSGLMGAFGVLAALAAQDRSSASGQVIDLAIYETVLRLLDFPVPVRTGSDQALERAGNRQPMAYALSNIYRARDGGWVGYSASSSTIARRVLCLLGGEEYANDPRFTTMREMCEHQEEIDQKLSAWVAERDVVEALQAFREADAVAYPVYSIDDILDDPHVAARESLVKLPGEEQLVVGVVPRLSRTPGSVRWLGPADVGQDSAEILYEVLGYDDAEVARLAEAGVVTVPVLGAPR